MLHNKGSKTIILSTKGKILWKKYVLLYTAPDTLLRIVLYNIILQFRENNCTTEQGVAPNTVI